MREIKFRIWDKSIPKNIGEADGKIKPSGQIIKWEYAINSTYFFDGIKGEYPIMQYTGIKDKNGADIYEGDIILSFKDYFEVFWDNKQSKFNYKNLRNGKNARIYYLENCEIIGNIYDNPELLEGVK